MQNLKNQTCNKKSLKDRQTPYLLKPRCSFVMVDKTFQSNKQASVNVTINSSEALDQDTSSNNIFQNEVIFFTDCTTNCVYVRTATQGTHLWRFLELWPFYRDPGEMKDTVHLFSIFSVFCDLCDPSPLKIVSNMEWNDMSWVKSKWDVLGG